MHHRRLHQLTALHTALLAVLLSFMLGTLAQAGHLHADRQSHGTEQCDLCVSFGGLMAAPAAVVTTLLPAATHYLHAIAGDVHTQTCVAGLPPVRGPPVS